MCECALFDDNPRMGCPRLHPGHPSDAGDTSAQSTGSPPRVTSSWGIAGLGSVSDSQSVEERDVHEKAQGVAGRPAVDQSKVASREIQYVQGDEDQEGQRQARS